VVYSDPAVGQLYVELWFQMKEKKLQAQPRFTMLIWFRGLRWNT